MRLRPYRPELVSLWVENLESEAQFWQHWIDKEGGSWGEDFLTRTGPGHPLPDWLTSRYSKRPLRVLDVGSGPISVLRRVAEDYPDSQLISMDPLAHVYNNLLSGSLERLPRITFGLSEFASSFIEGTFHIIHSQNALDHGFDPIRSIIVLLGMLKPGGVLVLGHAENEGVHENYSGLHHWNFEEREGDFVVWNREYSVNVSDEFRNVASITTKVVSPAEGSRRWLITTIEPHEVVEVANDAVSLSWPPIAAIYVEETLRALATRFARSNSYVA